MKPIHGNPYKQQMFDPEKLSRVALNICKIIRESPKNCPIDAIACIGTSGLSVASIASSISLVPMIYVRKEKELEHNTSHDGHAASGYLRNESTSRKHHNYLIVDDFIQSGKSLQTIIKHIDEEFSKTYKSGPRPRCVTIYMYDAVNITDGFRHINRINLPIKNPRLFAEDSFN